MNARFDAESVRVRLSLAEAKSLASSGSLEEHWPHCETRIGVVVSRAPEQRALSLAVARGHCSIEVSERALAEAIAAAPAKNAGVYSTGPTGIKYSLEIDAFTVKRATERGSK